VSAIQSEYSFMERDPEKDGVLAICEKLGIGFVAWGPVGMGYLTGRLSPFAKFDAKADLRSGFDRFTSANLAANLSVLEALKSVADRHASTPAQVVLARLLAQKPWIVPIPGTRSRDHLDENLGAVDLELSSADLDELATAFAQLEVQGGRMNAMQMKQVERWA
jgi:aryl-alcohol dehydrogenase-like predicted oxidoreductase